MDFIKDSQHGYPTYYKEKGASRNDILANREVQLQDLASELGMIRVLGKVGYLPKVHKVVDFGGGGGGSLIPFLRAAAPAALLTSLDSNAARVEEGRTRFPGVSFICADARTTGLPSEEFDIVSNSGLFFTVPDEAVAISIALEMVRVAKPGGIILIRDWAMPSPFNRRFKAVNRARLAHLFPGNAIKFVERGAMVSPLGRFFSSHLPSFYFLAQKLFPVGMKVYALMARSD